MPQRASLFCINDAGLFGLIGVAEAFNGCLTKELWAAWLDCDLLVTAITLESFKLVDCHSAACFIVEQKFFDF